MRGGGSVLTPDQKQLVKTWIAALLWIALIAIESTDWLSSEHTSRFLYPLLHFLIRSGASLHQKMRPLCGVLYLKLLLVSRLACYAALAVGSALDTALGYDCFFHVCSGSQPGRMASDFHSLANRRLQRCRVGQFCGADGTAFDISFLDLETASNECCLRLRGSVADGLNAIS